MYLNNNGWGLRAMIFLSSGLLLALLISIYFIAQLYSSMGDVFSSNQYFELETKLESAAIRYRNDYDLDISGEYKVSYGTLKKEGYIDTLKDNDGNLCGGYVIIKNGVDEVDNLNYEAYISCDNYVTDGY
jgi:hypothetical protein